VSWCCFLGMSLTSDITVTTLSQRCVIDYNDSRMTRCTTPYCALTWAPRDAMRNPAWLVETSVARVQFTVGSRRQDYCSTSQCVFPVDGIPDPNGVPFSGQTVA
jgi:hypothetical protein